MTEKYILKSDLEHTMPLPNESSVPAYILRRLEEHGREGRISCITNPTTEENFSYEDVIRLSGKVASSLHKLGFQKGDTLIYSSHDGANLHIFFLGVWRANGILRSSYPEDMEDQLLDRVLESKARWILCDKEQSAGCLKASKMAPWDVSVIAFGEADGCISAAKLYQGGEQECQILESTGSDIAIILPTSGTTGASKGAVFTHETILRLLITLEGIPLLGENDYSIGPILLVGKQTHFSGSLLALSCMTAGRPLLMLSTVTLDNIKLAVSKYKPNGLFLFPKFLMELVNGYGHREEKDNKLDLSSIQHISTGGVVVGPALVTTVKKFPSFRSLIILYGMTECGLLTTNVSWSVDNNNNRIMGSAINNVPGFSCGRLPPGTSLMVLDVQTGEPVGSDEKGELYFKSNLLCEGYLNKPKESADTFQNGWIRTGDLGYYDMEGFIYVVDRVKETFKYFNNHICPSELENVILGHPSVAEACVVGVKDPDGGDSIPRAYVVLKERSSANPEDIVNYTNRLLASYKHLRGGLFILPKLPQGKTGKITRRTLTELSVEESIAI